ncbi:MAG: hypothetical protein R3F60_02210 [bacterium]
MSEPTPPAPAAHPLKAQLDALEAGLDLHRRLAALTAQVEALKLEQSTEPTWEDGRWLGLLVGFGLLGGCVGFLTGLSTQTGITEKLLVAVMTFATGGLLTYGGFRWRRGTEAPRVDPLRVGFGVGAFAAMVIVGVCFGVAARDGRWLVPDARLAEAAAGPAAAGPAAPGRGAPGSGAPGSGPPAAPDSGLGALRGDCRREDLDVQAAAWRREGHVRVRGECATWFEPQLGLLHACAEAELKAEADLGDGVHRDRARALVDFGLSLSPQAPDLRALKGRTDP